MQRKEAEVTASLKKNQNIKKDVKRISIRDFVLIVPLLLFYLAEFLC
jgi:hypothetical protein